MSIRILSSSPIVLSCKRQIAASTSQDLAIGITKSMALSPSNGTHPRLSVWSMFLDALSDYL